LKRRYANLKPKIFLYDIETSPITAYTWSLWTEAKNYDNVVQDWCILTWAGKWLGEDEVHYDANHFHGDHLCDIETVRNLHHFIDEADIVVAHNGNKFDMKKMNARFIEAGLHPPAPYRKIDTLLEAKKNFAFTSNRLDALGSFLGLGRKKETGGFGLWTRCMAGDRKAFDEMLDYNIQDVLLLEEVYLKLRPWMHNHPNLGVFCDDTEQCPKCGGTHLQYRGYSTTQAGRYRRFQCQDCGGWGRERLSAIDKEGKHRLRNNI
jgi:hypothetical protein